MAEKNVHRPKPSIAAIKPISDKAAALGNKFDVPISKAIRQC